MDELEQIIEQLRIQESSAIDDTARLMARLYIKLAEALQREEKSKRQVIKAIANNLKTQRAILQLIGRPRKTKGQKHGKANTESDEQAPAENHLREVGTDG